MWKRKLMFASLYLSEGAPIGFLWLALPTRLRSAGVPIAEITGLTAVLVIPWTFKFAWAPLVDLLQSSRWSLKSWIVAAQTMMGLTLLPLLLLDSVEQFGWLTIFLVAHAIAAATQDVAIDALCISVTKPGERGQINGWMQTGMLLGRSLMGGGALVLAPLVGWQVVLWLLIAITLFSMGMVFFVPTPPHRVPDAPESNRWQVAMSAVKKAMAMKNTWVGLGFALTGGACFKALEVIFGPLLIDRGFTEPEVGSFAAVPMIGTMIIGALIGGRISDGCDRRLLVGAVLVLICGAVSSLALCDLLVDLRRSYLLLALLLVASFGIGVFTSASYAMLMDISHPVVAATQFSAFMGMTNGCESWSTWLAGRIASTSDYPLALLVLCGLSMLSLGWLPLLRLRTTE